MAVYTQPTPLAAKRQGKHKEENEMKRFVMCVVLAVMFLAPTIASASEGIVIGTRFTAVKVVDDSKSEGFVGSIDKLSPEGPKLYGNPFAVFHFTPNWGVEVAWNSFRAGADVTTYGRSDGSFEFVGPAIALIGRVPNKTIVTPYIGGGVTYYFGGFDAEDWWANGANGVEEMESDVKRRHMDVGNTVALQAFIGADVRVWRKLYADFRVGYEKFSSDVSFSSEANGVELYNKGPFDVPFNNFSTSLGLKYKF